MKIWNKIQDGNSGTLNLNYISMRLIITCVCCCSFLYCGAQNYEISSPDNSTKLKVLVTEDIQYSVVHNDIEIVRPSSIYLKLSDGTVLGAQPRVSRVKRNSVKNVLHPVVQVKSSDITEQYNELIISFRNHFSLIFRAYNEGVAYRFETKFNHDIVVETENAPLNVPRESHIYFPKENSFLSMNEVPYLYKKISAIDSAGLGSLPLLIRYPNNVYMLWTESDLNDYPGMWFQADASGNLYSKFPRVPTQLKNNGYCMDAMYVEKRADYIAETTGSRKFPWRAMLIADQPGDLLTNQLVYLLAPPAAEEDYSWIKPGHATLDWWGRRNVFDVDFKGGVNMATFRYFIDFNAKYDIPYFVFDDGWSETCDVYAVNENLDLPEIFDYAKSKDVGIILWIAAHTLEKDVSGILEHFASLGAKGIKVDFFNRDDQLTIRLYHEIAEAALENHLVVDFHGASKPTGLIRTYPNILTSEGLIEFEQNGVSDKADPVLHTTLPFIRMVAGPMDYLPGTMNNAQKKEFYQYGDRPVGQGTRAHSMALAVIFESPITMFPDSPSDYLKEDECFSFLAQIPVVWDETRVIHAEVGESVVIARRRGDDWYLGAISNWKEREINVPLDFLSRDSEYELEAFQDGVNAGSRAKDYKRLEKKINSGETLQIKMAEGGGWVGKFSR